MITYVTGYVYGWHVVYNGSTRTGFASRLCSIQFMIHYFTHYAGHIPKLLRQTNGNRQIPANLRSISFVHIVLPFFAGIRSLVFRPREPVNDEVRQNI